MNRVPQLGPGTLNLCYVLVGASSGRNHAIMNSSIYACLLSTLILASGSVLADSQPGQSVLIQAPEGNDYGHLTTMPSQQTLGERCIEMAREIESLKGKPQRRAALAARYRQECELK